MSLLFIAVNFAESGGKGGFFIPQKKMSGIADTQSSEVGDALLSFFGNNFSHRRGCQGKAVKQGKG